LGKRIVITLSAILLLAIGAMGYILLHGRNYAGSDPFIPVSKKACIVIETVDLRSFLNSMTTGKGLFGEAVKIREFEKFNSKLRFVADNLSKPEMRKLIPDGTAVISFYPAGDGSLNALLSMAVPGELRLRQAGQMLRSTGIALARDTLINDKPVIRAPYSAGGESDTIYFYVERGLLLVSNSGGLIKEALFTAENGTDVRSLPGFSRIWMASGKTEDKLFVVFSNLETVLRKLLSWGKKEMAGEMLKFADAAGGDIHIGEEGFSISGYSDCSDSTRYFSRFRNTAATEFQTYRILPSATAFFETVALPGNFRLSRTPGLTEKSYEVASGIRDFIGDEVTRAYIDIRENHASDNTVLIIRLKDPVQAEHSFLAAAGPDMEKVMFRPDDEEGIAVYKTVFHGITDSFLPGFTGDFEDSFVAFYDNFMITGSSFVTISRLLYDNVLNNTLANDMEYRHFESSLPSRANYFFFCVPSRFISCIEGFLNEDIVSSVRENRSRISRIGALGYKLSPSNGMLYNSLSVSFTDDEAPGESPMVWETLLDTVVCSKPYFFTNHLTGAREIFVQDLNNNVYLINAAGRVLWKVPLAERINGSIYTIDYYENGKNQMLFAGKNYLHLLDRNGNYVERYPVRLRSPATSPPALFDYDNNHNYRLLIAGEDRHIYSYDKSGNIVKGWKHYRTASVVDAPASYFQVSGKDYIAVCDASSVYLLDRYGSKRLSFREPVMKAKGSVLKLNSGAESFLICSSSDGTVQQIFFDGKINKFSLGKFSASHSFDLFDLDGDGFDEYLFIDKGKLYLYDHNRTEMFSRDFGAGKLVGPVAFSFSATDRKIGVFDLEKNLIYLVGEKGELVKGFPLKGASMFSVGKLTEKNNWNLIVGSPGRFLYNYKIETETN